MKRVFMMILSAAMLCLAGISQVSCNEIEDLNKGWWYYEVSGIRAKDAESDFSEVDDAFDAYFAHSVSYSAAEAEWKRFLSKIDDSKIVINGNDSCTVTLYWDEDYENPGLNTIVVGTKTWCNRSEAQNY